MNIRKYMSHYYQLFICMMLRKGFEIRDSGWWRGGGGGGAAFCMSNLKNAFVACV